MQVGEVLDSLGIAPATGNGKPRRQRRKARAQAPAASDKPTIVIGPDEERAVSEAVAALATRPDVFQRAGLLVHVTRDASPGRSIARPKGSPRIAILLRATLRERLASAATWVRPDGEGKTEPAHVPEWATKAVDARGQWPGIRRLEAVVETPVLRADGSILQTPGYDDETGLLYEPRAAFPPVPMQPTQADAERARDALLEVVGDFPFAGDEHRAAWLAATLTPLARFAFHGPAPLMLVDANVRGSGKGKLVDCIGLIVSGREMPRLAVPADADEIRKLVTTIAVAGEPLILLDNVTGNFGCSALDAALTAVSWSDRVLGSTRMVSDVPLFVTWYATGNNIALAFDTARRVLWVRLESREETPEEREGFQHPDLLGWVRSQRPRLAVAALTILRGYCVAGRPKTHLKPWGSFEAWSDLVREAVVWCGLPDPAGTRRELVTQADTEATALRMLLDGWQEIDVYARGLTVADAMKVLNDYPVDYGTLRAALAELVPTRPGVPPSPRSIGMKLHHLRGRVMGGQFLDKRQSAAGAVWLVKAADSIGTKDSKETISPPYTYAGARNIEGEGNSPFSAVSPLPGPLAEF